MRTQLLKQDLLVLLDHGYKIKPTDHRLTDVYYRLLYYHRKETIFARLPLDLLKYEIIPYLSTIFSITNCAETFTIILEKNSVKWLIYFDTRNPANHIIPIISIIATNNKYINICAIKNNIEYAYYIIFSRWMSRITLPFIVFKLRTAMNKWLVVNPIQ